MRLSKNFFLEEFLCACGCGFGRDVSAALVVSLQGLRDRLGRPVAVWSGARCLAHNRAIGSEDTSQHVALRAADIKVVGLAPEELAKEAKRIAAFREGGIGIYEAFTHVDVRPNGPARW